MTEGKEGRRSKRLDVHIDDLKEFANEFKDENDRSAVILGAAKIDYQLYQLLQKYLLPNISKRDELLEGEGPLSTLNSRIDICYRLGLIDASMTRALHMLRKIRNNFAHEVSTKSLNTGSAKDRVNELVMPIEHIDLYKIIVHNFRNSTTPSAKFRAAVALISFRIAVWCDYIKPIRRIEALDLESDISDAT